MQDLLEHHPPHPPIVVATTGARRVALRLVLAAGMVALAAGVAWVVHEGLEDGGPAWLARAVHLVQGWLRAAWTVHG